MAKCLKCEDTGKVMKMLSPSDVYDNPQDVTLEDLEQEGLIWDEPCTCATGQAEAAKESEKVAKFAACLLPGYTLADLPEPPFRLCDYFDLAKLDEFEEEYGREE